MSERYKDFPPGWGHLKVPIKTRKTALAGLAMYSPCKTRGLFAQRAAWEITRLVGARFLPWPSESWSSPICDRTWSGLCAEWRTKFGHFDAYAIYRRQQSDRAGLILLLMSNEEPIAFLKLDEGDGRLLRNEFDATAAVAAYQPNSFSVPEPLTKGHVDDWHYIAFSPLPVSLHRPPRRPPLNLILREIRSALGNTPRPAGTPSYWEPVHGDFTPWNLRELDDGTLALIDWEEAGWGPPGADELLYRAVAAHLWHQPLGRRRRDEAVDYWEKRIRNRLGKQDRDRNLGISVVRSLESIKETAHAGEQMATRRPRVLVFAYAGEPGKGSEPAAGWGLISTLAEVADCTVLTAPEHIGAIRKWETEHPESAVEFVEVPEARIGAYAKWHRLPWFLLYLNWLGRAYRVGRSIHDSNPFDAVHHATYSSYWLPSPIVRFGIPSIWGPVGGAARTPIRLWPILGWTGLWDEVLDRVSVRIASWWPATRRTWRDVSARIVQNEETLARLPRSLRQHAQVLNHVFFIENPSVVKRNRSGHILYLSSLESRKGPRLAIRALAYAADDVRLKVAGDGPERRALQRLATKLRVEDRVEFLGHVRRERAIELLTDCAAAVFTGVREEGGIALAEAMLCGTPVIVLANGGASTVAAAGTDPRRVVLVQPSTVRETARRIGAVMTQFSRNPQPTSGATMDQNAARETLQQILHEVLQPSSTP